MRKNLVIKEFIFSLTTDRYVERRVNVGVLNVRCLTLLMLLEAQPEEAYINNRRSSLKPHPGIRRNLHRKGPQRSRILSCNSVKT